MWPCAIWHLTTDNIRRWKNHHYHCQAWASSSSILFGLLGFLSRTRYQIPSSMSKPTEQSSDQMVFVPYSLLLLSPLAKRILPFCSNWLACPTIMKPHDVPESQEHIVMFLSFKLNDTEPRYSNPSIGCTQALNNMPRSSTPRICGYIVCCIQPIAVFTLEEWLKRHPYHQRHPKPVSLLFE